jgi:hypothetical protein
MRRKKQAETLQTEGTGRMGSQITAEKAAQVWI